MLFNDIGKEKCSTCDKENAIKVAQNKFKGKGFYSKDYKLKSSEDSLYYHLEFKLIDTTIEGGGAYFKITKKDCKIIEQKFYQ